MKRLLALLSCFFGIACTSQAMTPAQFTDEFAKALHSASPSSKVVVKADFEIMLTTATGQESALFLDNAYDEYLKDPEEVKDIIQRYAVSLLEAKGSDAAIDRDLVVPIIKDRQWPSEMQSLKREGLRQAPENVFEDFNGQLVVVYAEDGPTSIRYLTPDNLEKGGLSRTELRSLAIRNLKRILPEIELHKGPQVSMITAGGNYEACLLLLNDLWTDGRIQVEGDIVVAVPSRDLLLLTGSKTPGGIAKLREIAKASFQQAPYRLTDELFIYRDGQFRKLETP